MDESPWPAPMVVAIVDYLARWSATLGSPAQPLNRLAVASGGVGQASAASTGARSSSDSGVPYGSIACEAGIRPSAAAIQSMRCT